MHAQRLLENLEAQQGTAHDDYFGNPRLIDDAYSTTPFAAVNGWRS